MSPLYIITNGTYYISTKSKNHFTKNKEHAKIFTSEFEAECTLYNLTLDTNKWYVDRIL